MEKGLVAEILFKGRIGGAAIAQEPGSIDRFSFRRQGFSSTSMASAGGGGDKGIIKAMITHPKPSEEALIVPTNKSLVLQDSMVRTDLPPGAKVDPKVKTIVQRLLSTLEHEGARSQS